MGGAKTVELVCYQDGEDVKKLRIVWRKNNAYCYAFIVRIHRDVWYKFIVLHGVSHSALSGTTSCCVRITPCAARAFAIRAVRVCFALSFAC